MSDIRLVNVVPIVNGWNDAAKKNLEEAKTLMASGNHLDYNKGVVKESVANLVSGFADDLMSAPFIDPETLQPMAHWDGQYDGYYDGEPVVRCKDCEHFKNYGKTSLLADGKNIKAGWCYRRIRYDEEYRMPPDGFCSYGKRRNGGNGNAKNWGYGGAE
jgi:hypothetical protein